MIIYELNNNFFYDKDDKDFFTLKTIKVECCTSINQIKLNYNRGYTSIYLDSLNKISSDYDEIFVYFLDIKLLERYKKEVIKRRYGEVK